jgi:hypothetical protein
MSGAAGIPGVHAGEEVKAGRHQLPTTHPGRPEAAVTLPGGWESESLGSAESPPSTQALSPAWRLPILPA